MAHLNWFDTLLLGIMFFSMLFGLVKGFLKEIISLITWIAAFLVSVNYSHEFGKILSVYFKEEVLISIVSFLGLFIIVLIIGSLINSLITYSVRGIESSGSDKFLGLIFGLCRGFLVSLLCTFLVSNSVAKQSDWFKQSVLQQQTAPIIDFLQKKVHVIMNDVSIPFPGKEIVPEKTIKAIKSAKEVNDAIDKSMKKVTEQAVLPAKA
jgi:membrane protein required for colicin V production